MADIKDLLGDQYKEGMTAEEITTAFASKDFIDKSTLPPSVDKVTFDKTASELAAAKKALKDFETKNLSAEEQLKRQQEEFATSQKTLQAELSKLAAKELFIGAGLKETEFADLMGIVVRDDVESTKTAASQVVKMLTAQKTELEKSIKAELLKGTPTPPGGAGATTLGDLDKKIAEAGEAGNLSLQAALVRQRFELLNKK